MLTALLSPVCRPGRRDDRPRLPGRAAILQVVDVERPPLRVFFGTAPLDVATSDYESRLATRREWQPLAVRAYGR